MADYNKSVLYDYHEESGAKFAPANSWMLVSNYSEGAVAEQQHAEKQAAIFDNSHFAKYRLTYDKSSEKKLDNFFCRKISNLENLISKFYLHLP